jgi:hypothetical protein
MREMLEEAFAVLEGIAERRTHREKTLRELLPY